MKRNRWLIALSAMGLHLCIGSVYAWSVLTKPIMESMGFTLKETTWTFSLAILTPSACRPWLFGQFYTRKSRSRKSAHP